MHHNYQKVHSLGLTLGIVQFYPCWTALTVNQMWAKQQASFLEKPRYDASDPRSDGSCLGILIAIQAELPPNKLETCFSYSLFLNLVRGCPVAENKHWLLGDVDIGLSNICSWEKGWLDDGRPDPPWLQTGRKTVTLYWAKSSAVQTGLWLWDQKIQTGDYSG